MLKLPPPALPLRRVRTTQPLTMCELDWTNPILRAINPIAVYAPIGNRMHEFVRGGAAISYYGNNDLLQPNVRIAATGIGGYTGPCAADNYNGHWDTQLRPDSSYKFLFTAVTTTSAIPSASYSTGSHDGTNRFYMGLSSSTTSDLNMAWGAVAPVYSRVTPVALDVMEKLAFDVSPSLILAGYQNGSPLGGGVCNWVGGASTRNFYLGKRTNNVGAEAHAISVGAANLTHLVIIGRNNISAVMHKSLSDNPWQIFQPERINIPVSRTSTQMVQPPDATSEIDWNNPITQGMVGFIDGSVTGRKGDMVTNVAAPQATGAISTPSGNSFGGATTGIAYPRLNAGALNWDITSPVMSMFTAYHPTAHGSGASIASNGWGISSGFAIYSHFSNGTPMFVIYEAGGVAKAVQGPIDGIKLNTLNTGCVTSDGSNVRGYQNGTLSGTTATTGANLNYDGTFHRVALGGSTADGGGLAGCAVHMAGLWNRTLTLAEIKSLHNNPWQIFKSKRLSIAPREVTTPRQSFMLGGTSPAPATAAIIGIPRRVRTSQPQTSVGIHPYWLARGLQLVFDGKRVVWQRGRGTLTSSTITGGPKQKASPKGIATGFGATSGTGTTDCLTDGILDAPKSGMRSIVAHVFVNGAGGGGLGRVFQSTSGSGITSVGDEGVWLSGVGGMTYNRICSSTIGMQYTTHIALPTGRWTSSGMSFLGDYPTNTPPILFIDGVLVATDLNQAANSTFAPSTSMNLAWGNRASDSLRNWDGVIGPVLIFDGYLTPQEHASLSANPWQIFAPDSTPIWGPV